MAGAKAAVVTLMVALALALHAWLLVARSRAPPRREASSALSDEELLSLMPPLADAPPPPPPPLALARAAPGTKAFAIWAHEAKSGAKPKPAAAARDPTIVRLPRNTACLEFDDVRAARDRCRGGAPTASDAPHARHGAPRTIACARSLEGICVDRATSAASELECGVRGGNRTSSSTSAAAGARRRSVGWRNVVFAMALHHSEAEHALLQASADTWLRMVDGAHLVLATDADDPRPDDEVAPALGDGVTAFVHRCALCRGLACGGAGERDGTCPGLREGWLARSKVLDLFVELARRYVANATMRPARRFFVKVDPDTVVLPHNLLAFAGELHDTLGPAQPFLFGMAACRVPSFNLCHAAGGAGYGLSRRALAALDSFVRDGYPPYGDAEAFLERVDRFTYGGEDVTLAFALKKSVGATVVNCGSFYQHRPDTYRHLQRHGERWVRWPLSRSPVSFHKFKEPAALRRFFSCALYAADGHPRRFPRALFNNGSAPNETRSCDDPWLLPPAEPR